MWDYTFSGEKCTRVNSTFSFTRFTAMSAADLYETMLAGLLVRSVLYYILSHSFSKHHNIFAINP